MALLKILEYPDPFLYKEAIPVENIDQNLLTLIDDMIETMFDAPGVGLAAPQVGSDKRLIVYNPSAGLETDSREDGDDEDNEAQTHTIKNEARAIINPEIIAASGSLVSEKEACLSVPDYSANVKRYSNITVRGLNVDGKKIEFDADDIQAVILQHEIDHLDGILYIERISALKRNMYKKKIQKRLKN